MKKDIEWLKNEVEKRIKTIESDDISFVGSEYYDEGYIDGMRDVLYRINQPDKTEALSQEWIDKNKFEVNGWNEAVHVEGLQDLLVPKQEEATHKQVEKYLLDKNIRVIDIDVYEKMQSDLAELENKIVIEKPVIPQFVAECIKSAGSNRESNKEYVIRSIIDQYYEGNFEPIVYDWFGEKGNLLKFYRAVDNGYTVEKEMKYYVSDIEGNILLWKTSKGVRKTNSEVKLGQYDDWAILFTEQEIKDYDERYFAFAVPAEEDAE